MAIGHSDALDERRKRVLLVDNEHAICAFVSSVLEDIGYSVVCAASRGEARLAASRNEFACALIEMMLPDGSGEELAEDMARLGVPVIVMSGHPDGIKSGRASRHTFLQKPFSVAGLVRVIVDQTVDDSIEGRS